MSFHLKNERFMNDFELNETLYLPEIEIGGKTYLPGSFRALTGLLKQYAGYTRVVELTYHVKKPESSAELLPLNGPLWSLNNDPRACLIEIARPIGTPLKTITYAGTEKTRASESDAVQIRKFRQGNRFAERAPVPSLLPVTTIRIFTSATPCAAAVNCRPQPVIS